MAIKHFSDGVEVSSIVEVFKELDVAGTLNLPNDNYTGTAVYQWTMRRFNADNAVARIGVVNYYNKADIVSAVTAYLARKSVKSIDIKALIKFIKENPQVAEELSNLAFASK